MKFLILLQVVCFILTNKDLMFIDKVDFFNDPEKKQDQFNQDLEQYKEKIRNNQIPRLSQQQQEQMESLQDLMFVHQTKEKKIKTPKENQESFQIQQFLDEFQKFDCHRGFNEETNQDIHDDECMKSVQNDVFGIFSDISVRDDDIYRHFEKNIYKPLALKSKKQENLTQTITDLYNQKESLLKNLNFDTSYGILEKFLLKNFDQIIDANDSVLQDKNFIQAKISKIIQAFHLFWNVLRNKNQINKARIDTKTVLGVILQKYQKQQRRQYMITNKIIELIKGAYKKFIKADQSFKMIKFQGLRIVSDIITKRYISAISLFSKSKEINESFYRELARILQLGKIFHIYSFLKNIKYKKRQFNYLIDSIKNQYDAKKIQLQHGAIKNFTACLILKFKHQYHVLSTLISPLNLVNNIYADMFNEKDLTVKVYYSLLNHLILVPHNCDDQIYLKTCIMKQMNNSLQTVTNLYNLKKKLSGWIVFDYITNGVTIFFQDADPQIWKNKKLLFAYYFQQLFKFIYAYKKAFSVNDYPKLQILENMIVNTMYKFNKERNIRDLDQGLFDQLDMDLYDYFLDMKANVDDFYNEQDFSILQLTQRKIYNFIDKFQVKHDSIINSNFYDLLNSIKKTVDFWANNLQKSVKNDILKIPDTYQGPNFLTLFKEYEPNSFLSIDSDQVLSNYNQELFNQKVYKEMDNNQNVDYFKKNQSLAQQNSKYDIGYQNPLQEQQIETKPPVDNKQAPKQSDQKPQEKSEQNQPSFKLPKNKKPQKTIDTQNEKQKEQIDNQSPKKDFDADKQNSLEEDADKQIDGNKDADKQNSLEEDADKQIDIDDADKQLDENQDADKQIDIDQDADKQNSLEEDADKQIDIDDADKQLDENQDADKQNSLEEDADKQIDIDDADKQLDENQDADKQNSLEEDADKQLDENQDAEKQLDENKDADKQIDIDIDGADKQLDELESDKTKEIQASELNIDQDDRKLNKYLQNNDLDDQLRLIPNNVDSDYKRFEQNDAESGGVIVL